MPKNPILWLFVGWLVSLFFPPQAVFAMFRGRTNG